MATSLPQPAATVILMRDEPAFEILMVQRHADLRFASNALAFPGGKLEAQDEQPAWRDHAICTTAMTDGDRALRICALREAFEETGVLLCQPEDRLRGSMAQIALCREAVLLGTMPFMDLIGTFDLKLDLNGMALLSRWITPPVSPKRFDTYFYVAAMYPGFDATPDCGETVAARWMSGESLDAVHLDDPESILLPTRLNLSHVRAAADSAAALALARKRRPIAVEPLVEMRDGRKIVRIRPEYGYGEVIQPL